MTPVFHQSLANIPGTHWQTPDVNVFDGEGRWLTVIARRTNGKWDVTSRRSSKARFDTLEQAKAWVRVTLAAGGKLHGE